LKDLGLLSYFLGISINYENGRLLLNQTQYIKHLLDKVGLTECQLARTPCELKKLSKGIGELLYDPSEFR
jgi:hypothetical protein